MTSRSHEEEAERVAERITRHAPRLDFQRSRGSGQPLEPAARTFFESRFAHDFSRVRVHTDATAAAAARSLHARAFTSGKDIVFGAGQYEPGTAAGQKLLAHELTHVRQQSAGVRGVQCDPLPGSPAPEPNYTPATNFTELITLIKAAETKLKAAGQDVNTRIKTLRGIYYGTKWSMDFGVDHSTVRNTGFTYFLYGTSALMTGGNLWQKVAGDPGKAEPAPEFVPMDPRPLLGTKLFTALRDSPEVTEADGRKVDVGHLIIGLEARLAKGGQEKQELNDPRTLISLSPLAMGGTGLELTTWVGDLGAGTAKVAQARVSNPSAAAKPAAFGDLHSFGAEVNLEGDLAAFLVGLPAQSTTPYGLTLSETTGIAGAIQSYLTPSGSEWTARSKRFLSLYGAVFDATNNLTNRAAVQQTFAAKIQKFAVFYKETRLKDDANAKQSTNQLTAEQIARIDAQMKLISEKIPAAATDVASLFVDALLASTKTPTRGVAPP